MDIFYEESSIANNSGKKEKKYKIIHYASMFFLVLAIILTFIFVMFIGDIGFMIVSGLPALFCWGNWFLLYKWKMGVNVSYDYSFVSGELRIAKVINVNKRKLVARFDCNEIIQVGDVDNPAFDRFRASPGVKTVFCTSNYEAAEGKFFMYIHVDYNGKKLLVLECREELLVNMLKFMKRTALDRDYISQEKKNK
jgi:hypothetical protein